MNKNDTFYRVRECREGAILENPRWWELIGSLETETNTVVEVFRFTSQKYKDILKESLIIVDTDPAMLKSLSDRFLWTVMDEKNKKLLGVFDYSWRS